MRRVRYVVQQKRREGRGWFDYTGGLKQLRRAREEKAIRLAWDSTLRLRIVRLTTTREVVR